MTDQDRQLLAAIVDSSEDAIVSRGMDGIVRSWNKGAERLYGYTAEEAIGRHISFIIPPHRMKELAGVMSGPERGESVDRYETERLRKDGSTVHISLSHAPVRDEAGRITSTAAIARDITADVVMREELARERARLVISQRVARTGSWEWDIRSGAVIWSDELYALYGVDPRTFTPSFATFMECVHPADRAAVSADIAAAIEQRRGFALEHRIRRPDGSTRAMAARGDVVLGDDLAVVRMYGTSQDITESRALQEELRRGNETLELVSRATNDMVWDWDLLTGVVKRSQGVELYGYAADEVRGENAWWASRVHPEDSARVEASLRSARDSGAATWSAQYRFERADGTYAAVLDRAQIVRDGTGQAVRMVGSLMDLTDRLRAEELARRGAASAELLARASHELRTPLNAILGFADLLEQRLEASVSTRERRYLQNIRGSGRHLLRLVDRLLQIATADSGRTELRPIVVGLFGVIAPVYAELAPEAEAKGVELKLDIADASVRIDAERITAVLRELVANSLAATPPGGSIEVRARIPDDDLVIEVTDSGRGIPAAARGRVFEVFQRIEDDGGAGRTGLGLALCRELVELHGGSIDFESEPGRRTTFRVHLPHVAWRRERTDRVLIVDDEPNDADLAMSIARDAGLRCEVVGTLAEGLAAIRRDRPTALVLDLQLPDGAGTEILRWLAASDRSVPVAVVSAFGDEMALPEGTVRMAKPIVPSELSAWLREVTGSTVA